MLPLLTQHDRTAFEITCYSLARRPDDYTDRLRQQAEHWFDVAQLDDAALAARIHHDGLDILIDLTMHMAGGRPGALARKPAPLQISWLAYPGTTGVQAVDYRISDPRLDPSGTESAYTERTLRLPDTFWCYDPLAGEPAPSELPALANGYVTFGCLTQPCKHTDQALRLWAPRLSALPRPGCSCYWYRPGQRGSDSRERDQSGGPASAYNSSATNRARNTCAFTIRSINAWIRYRITAIPAASMPSGWAFPSLHAWATRSPVAPG